MTEPSYTLIVTLTPSIVILLMLAATSLFMMGWVVRPIRGPRWTIVGDVTLGLFIALAIMFVIVVMLYYTIR